MGSEARSTPSLTRYGPDRTLRPLGGRNHLVVVAEHLGCVAANSASKRLASRRPQVLPDQGETRAFEFRPRAFVDRQNAEQVVPRASTRKSGRVGERSQSSVLT